VKTTAVHVTGICFHNAKTFHNAETPVCNEQKNGAYYSCDNCTQLFAEDGTTPIASIPKLGLAEHTPGQVEDVKYLASEGDCQTNKTYYQSCTVCEEKLLDKDTFIGSTKGGHVMSNTWTQENGQHFHKCTITNCTYKEDEAACSGGTATCTAKAICSVCQNPYGDFAKHNYTQQVQDAAHLKTEAATCTEFNVYWYDCANCDANAKDDGNAADKYYTSTVAGGHVFTEQIEDAAHLVAGSGADCQNAKKYYYNCKYCAEKGTTTWDSDTYGPHDMATGNDWSKDASGHWHGCKTSGCGEKADFVAHTPDHVGNATEEYPILCTVCGYEIEAQLGHTHVFNKEVATDEYEATPATCKAQATYYKSCKCGLAGTETFASGALADHKWDPATCTEPKTCSVCHLTDGTANGHTEGTEWKRDDNNHWHICKKCDAVIDASVEAHNPDHQGGATEEYPILCTECGYEMEAQLNHTHVYDKEVVAEKYLVSEATCQKYAVYKLSCKCGAAGTETFEDVNAGYADHKWNSAWTKDETGHWHECKTDGCEEVNEYAAHTPGEDWKRDKNNHWHICEECNAVIADSKEAHTDADSNKVCDVCDYQMKAEKSESSGRVEKYGWLETDGNWYYHLGTKKAKGWYEVKNYWYYFKKNYPNAGAMQTGWIFDEGRWYYLGENGVMKTGWRLLGGKWYYLGQSGAMKTGWFFDPNYNAWYYLHDENGDMLVNTTTPDGYYVGADGKWVQ